MFRRFFLVDFEVEGYMWNPLLLRTKSLCWFWFFYSWNLNRGGRERESMLIVPFKNKEGVLILLIEFLFSVLIGKVFFIFVILNSFWDVEMSRAYCHYCYWWNFIGINCCKYMWIWREDETSDPLFHFFSFHPSFFGLSAKGNLGLRPNLVWRGKRPWASWILVDLCFGLSPLVM